MKVKLLKKVRKRFEIIYYPSGSTESFDADVHYIPYLKLLDKKNYLNTITPYMFSYDRFSDEEKNKVKERICNELKSKIISILRKEGYRGRKDKKIITPQQQKLWHIPKSNTQ